MIILSAQHIAKSFGVNAVLRDVSLTVQQGDRIGLVGVNGCGKSTLLRILTEQELPDHLVEGDGEIARSAKTSIGVVVQRVGEYFFCPRCGQALQNGAACCPACGLPLTFPAGDLPPCPPLRKNSSNCLAVTSLVLGICSILSCLLLLIDSVGGFFCFNSIPLGAAGVALGIIARGEIRSRDPRGSIQFRQIQRSV